MLLFGIQRSRPRHVFDIRNPLLYLLAKWFMFEGVDTPFSFRGSVLVYSKPISLGRLTKRALYRARPWIPRSSVRHEHVTVFLLFIYFCLNDGHNGRLRGTAYRKR